MDHGWSLKWLNRQIVTSATYRQSSVVTPEKYARDPYNRLLARGPRFRVDAEIVRDIALETSGLLYSRLGGPSVFPPAPDFLFQPPASYGPKIWNEEKGPDRYRRATLHVPLSFGSVPGLADVRRAQRRFFVRAACAFQHAPAGTHQPKRAAVPRMCAGTGIEESFGRAVATSSERLTYAFRRCLSRQPTHG